MTGWLFSSTSLILIQTGQKEFVKGCVDTNIPNLPECAPESASRGAHSAAPAAVGSAGGASAAAAAAAASAPESAGETAAGCHFQLGEEVEARAADHRKPWAVSCQHARGAFPGRGGW